MQDMNVEKARQIIASNRYMTLATCRNNLVWIAPVAYAVDESYNFYWYSTIDATHSQQIAYNPDVAIAIFNSTEPSETADGLQLSGIAAVVEDNELLQVMNMYWLQQFPDPDARATWIRPIEDFSGNAIQRFFKFTPLEVYKLDTEILEVDRRLPINLDKLRQHPAKPI